VGELLCRRRGLLGWSSTDPLPPKFKASGRPDRGTALARKAIRAQSILWVEALDDDNFPSGVATRLSPALHRPSGRGRQRPAGPGQAPTGKPQGGSHGGFSAMAKGGKRGGDGLEKFTRPSTITTDWLRRSLFRRSASTLNPAHGENQTINFTAASFPPGALPPRNARIAAPFSVGLTGTWASPKRGRPASRNPLIRSSDRQGRPHRQPA